MNINNNIKKSRVINISREIETKKLDRSAAAKK